MKSVITKETVIKIIKSVGVVWKKKGTAAAGI